MSDIRPLKSRDVQIIKLPKVKYGPETSILNSNKPIGIETSSIRRLFYSSLSKQLIYFLLDNEMMSYSCLNIEPLDIMEQGRNKTLAEESDP